MMHLEAKFKNHEEEVRIFQNPADPKSHIEAFTYKASGGTIFMI
jgi:hypothetical protein